MKGYWNNGGSLGKPVICGLVVSESQEYSAFATSNSYFRVRPPYNGTAFDALDFNNPNIQWQGTDFCFDWVPGAYNTLESLIVGETCNYNTPDGLFPSDPNAVQKYTDVLPAFFVRVSSGGWGGDRLPPLSKLKFGGTWKKNKCYASMGSAGLKADTKPLDAYGNVLYNDSMPTITAVRTEQSAIIQPDPEKRYAYESAVWKIEPAGKVGGTNIYSGYRLPLLQTIAEGEEATTVARWATLQPGAKTTGGAIVIGWRLILVPYWILTYYQNKLGTKYPYLP